ncbi:unnamed protein product, partial [Mesorhabditis belari]|uniref:Uncharacterized protein n=1 Tax=Mesorhabditis belari TaxID=2138241 RepID=A0AAF3J6V0_9BILA
MPGDGNGPPRLRVKDLAKRFEEISTTPFPQSSRSQKRVGKFRIIASNDPIKVGVARKRSSLKKKALSSYEIYQAKHSTRRKSQSLSRATSKESLASSSGSKSRLFIATTRQQPLVACTIEKFAQKVAQENPEKPMLMSPRGEKPALPAKPQRLSSKNSEALAARTDSYKIATQQIEAKPSTSSQINENEEKPNVQLSPASRPAKAPPPAPPSKPPSKERILRRGTGRLCRSDSISSDSVYQVLDSYEEMPTFLRQNEFVPRLPSLPPPPVPSSTRLSNPQNSVISAIRPLPELPKTLPTLNFAEKSPNHEPNHRKSKAELEIRPKTRPPSPPQISPRNSDDQFDEKKYGNLSDQITINSQQSTPTMRVLSIDESDLYEEIGGVERGNQPGSSTSGSTSNSDYVTSIYCGGEAEICTMKSSCNCVNCKTRRTLTTSTHELSTYDKPSLQERNCSTLGRALGRKIRPVSTIEFDKLIKFKSDFHLNLSKKMERLRKRVVAEKNRRSARFTLNAQKLDTDRYGGMNNEDDKYIYGDDWSTDDGEVEIASPDLHQPSLHEVMEPHLQEAFPSLEPECSTISSTILCAQENEDLCFSPEVQEMTIGLDGVSVKDEDIENGKYFEARSLSSRLQNSQPLYQIYMLTEQEKILEAQLSEVRRTGDSAKATTLRRESSSSSSDSGLRADCSHSTTHSSSALTSSTSLRRDRLESVRYGSQRSLWCELPEVKNAGLLETLDEETKQLQEAYFEVITSEASYLRSLNILITHFMADKAMLGSKSSVSVISNDDRKHLFSNIFAVRDSSERLLVDLETRLDESLVLDCICDILMQHFDTNFDAYIKYCSNQVYQDRTLRRLKTESSAFLAAVSRLEADKQCQGLDMRSFLMLPMQRITRYPLLIYAILERQPIGSESHRVAARTLALANQVVSNCNEGARRMERTEQLLDVDRRLLYKDNDLKRIPLVTANRHLVKRGCLYELSEKGTRSLLHSRQKARHIYLFLFSDLLLITKQKMNGTYVCQDYAERRFVDTSPLEPENPKIPCGLLHQLPTRPHLFSCVLMRNARGKQSEWLLSADSESDRERWLSAMRPPASANPEEKVYAEWDCPQAVTMHAYSKAQDDELDLSVGEHVNILRKMPDGWFYGERVRDGVGGWFPSSYVQQLINDHTRAKNYRQRLRLIQAAADLRNDHPLSIGARSTRPPALIQKLRRMSNPKQLFQSNSHEK